MTVLGRITFRAGPERAAAFFAAFFPCFFAAFFAALFADGRRLRGEGEAFLPRCAPVFFAALFFAAFFAVALPAFGTLAFLVAIIPLASARSCTASGAAGK